MARSPKPAQPEVAIPAPVIAADPKKAPPLVNEADIDIKWNDPTAVAAFMARVGDNMSAAGVWANYATAFFQLGRMARLDKKNVVDEAIIDNAFNAYRSARAKRAKAMEDSTADTYRSAGRSVATAAATWPHDTTHFLAYLQKDIGSLQWSMRGGRALDIVKAFQHEPKDVDAIRAHFPKAEVDGNLMDEAVRVRDTVSKWLDDAAKLNATILGNADVTRAFNVLRTASVGMVAAAAAAGITPTPKKRGGKELSDTAKAIIAAGTAAAPSPTSH